MSAQPSEPELPLSQPRLPEVDAPDSLEPAVATAVEAPTRLADAPFPVTREQVSAYLAKLSTRALINRLVGAHVGKKTPRHVKADLFSDAVIRALESKWLPPSPDKMDGWLATLTSRAVVDYFRRGAADLRWLRRDVEVEDQPAEPPEEIDGDDAWLLTNWLADQVKHDPSDQQTYAMIVLKAQSERTYESIAAEHDITPAALANRIYRLRLKYLPVRVRQEQQRNRTIMGLLLGAVVLAVVALLVARYVSHQLVAPPPSRTAVPTDVRIPAEPPPPVFNQADPTDESKTAPDLGRKPGQ
jgi:DNA-directed RNA polymerase specialized sigma24 family protein